ncbi:hypothetical protein F1880_001882 [Penicillium rolfsii]|nr:hypothetical protein F1880_001882 [Penicillium rolfsii]
MDQEKPDQQARRTTLSITPSTTRSITPYESQKPSSPSVLPGSISIIRLPAKSFTPDRTILDRGPATVTTRYSRSYNAFHSYGLSAVPLQLPSNSCLIHHRVDLPSARPPVSGPTESSHRPGVWHGCRGSSGTGGESFSSPVGFASGTHTENPLIVHPRPPAPFGFGGVRATRFARMEPVARWLEVGLRNTAYIRDPFEVIDNSTCPIPSGALCVQRAANLGRSDSRPWSVQPLRRHQALNNALISTRAGPCPVAGFALGVVV